MSSQPVRRLTVLDNLRGLSAIYVVLMHTAWIPHPPLQLPGILASAVRFGGTGVFLFFVISGYSLSMTMSRHLRHSAPMLSYGLSRFLRIAPLFYALLLVTLVRDRVLFDMHHSIREILANAAFLFNFIPNRQTGIVWASWTIGIEMVYYCLFPLFHRLGVKMKLGIAAGVMLIYGIVVKIHGVTGILFLLFIGFIPLFMFGELAFHFVKMLHGREDAKAWGYLATGCGLAILVGCVLSGSPLGPVNFVNGIILRFVIGAAYALLLFGLVIQPFRIVENQVLSFYGKISYSFYLCHPPIVYLLSRGYPMFYRHFPPTIAYACCACLTLAVVTGIAALSYRFIEEPGVELGKRLITRTSTNVRPVPLAV